MENKEAVAQDETPGQAPMVDEQVGQPVVETPAETEAQPQTSAA